MVKLTSTEMGRATEMRKRGMTYNQIGQSLQVSTEAVRKRLMVAGQQGQHLSSFTAWEASSRHQEGQEETQGLTCKAL
jgi:orotate phosphoribosyltransferase-like protein